MKKAILIFLCLFTSAVSIMGLVGCSQKEDNNPTFTPISDGGTYNPDGDYE